MLNDLLKRHGLVMNHLVSVPDYSIHLELVLDGIGGCLVPEQMITGADIAAERRNGLCVFEIEDMFEKSDVSLLLLKGTYRPKYLECFVELLREAYSPGTDAGETSL